MLICRPSIIILILHQLQYRFHVGLRFHSVATVSAFLTVGPSHEKPQKPTVSAFLTVGPSHGKPQKPTVRTALTVAVDAPHALLVTHRIPGKVVIHHDVAELEVNTLAAGLG